MRNVFKILLLLCVIAGFVALTHALQKQDNVPSDEKVTDITFSYGTIIF